jgi:hypothetical protein
MVSLDESGLPYGISYRSFHAPIAELKDCPDGSLAQSIIRIARNITATFGGIFMYAPGLRKIYLLPKLYQAPAIGSLYTSIFFLSHMRPNLQ